MSKKNWKAGLLVGAALTCFGASLTAANAEITITRDSYGVPHIKGKTNQEMFFGFGYAMARDRLIQITKLKIFSSHKFPLDTVQAPDETRFLNLTLSGIEYLRSQYPHMEENIEDAYQDLRRTSDGSGKAKQAIIALDCTAAGINQFLRDTRALLKINNTGAKTYDRCGGSNGDARFRFGETASVEELEAFTKRLSDQVTPEGEAKNKMSGEGSDRGPLSAAEARMPGIFAYNIWDEWTGKDVLKVYFNRIMDEYSNRNEEVNYMDLLRLLEARHENTEKARRIFNSLKWVADPEVLTQISIGKNEVRKRWTIFKYREAVHKRLLTEGNKCLAYEKEIGATSIAANFGNENANISGFPANTSNFWAIVGNKVAPGIKAVFMNGPQVVTHDPSSFYPFKIESDEGFKYAGTTFAGTLSFMTGRNDTIAMGFTAANSDVSDMFCIKVVTRDGGKTYEGENLTLVINPLVKDERDPIFYVKDKEWSVDRLQRGIDDRAVAYIRRVAWTGETGRTFAAMLAASQAGSIAEWHREHNSSAVNFNFGAVSNMGEASYRLSGTVPNRVGHLEDPNQDLQELPENHPLRFLWWEDIRLPVANSPDKGWSKTPAKFYRLQETITEGYLSSWNHKPYFLMPDSDLYYDSWFKWDRAEIMNRLIERENDWDLEKSIQMNRDLSMIDVNFNLFFQFLKHMQGQKNLSQNNRKKINSIMDWGGMRTAIPPLKVRHHVNVSCFKGASPVHSGEYLFMNWYENLANKFSQAVLNLSDDKMIEYLANPKQMPPAYKTNWFGRYAKLKQPKLNTAGQDKGTYDNSQNIQILGRTMLSNLYYSFDMHNSYDTNGWDFFTNSAPNGDGYPTEESKTNAMRWMLEALDGVLETTKTPCPSIHIFATRLIKGMRVSGDEEEPRLTYFRNKGAQNHVVEFRDGSVRSGNVVAPGVREYRGFNLPAELDLSRNQLDLYDRDGYRDMKGFGTSSSSARRSGSMGRLDRLFGHLRPSVPSDDGERSPFPRIAPYSTE